MEVALYAALFVVIVLAVVVYLGMRQGNDPHHDALRDGSNVSPVAVQEVHPVESQPFQPDKHYGALANANGLSEDIEAFLDQMATRLEGRWFYSKVVGVSHLNDDGSSRQAAIRTCKVRDELHLVPEPENRWDFTAVRVEADFSDQVGYLDRRLAQEVTRSLAAGGAWRCFVAKITGQISHHGINIALIEWDPAYLSRPQSHRDFESFMDQVAEKYAGNWKYIGLVGLTKRNEDGSDRRQLWREVKPMAQLCLRSDVDDLGNISRFHVLDQDDRVLGMIPKNQSRLMVDSLAEGCRWVLCFRDNTEEPSFRPNVALMRMSKVGNALSRKEQDAGATQC